MKKLNDFIVIAVAFLTIVIAGNSFALGCARYDGKARSMAWGGEVKYLFMGIPVSYSPKRFATVLCMQDPSHVTPGDFSWACSTCGAGYNCHLCSGELTPSAANRCGITGYCSSPGQSN